MFKEIAQEILTETQKEKFRTYSLQLHKIEDFERLISDIKTACENTRLESSASDLASSIYDDAEEASEILYKAQETLEDIEAEDDSEYAAYQEQLAWQQKIFNER